MKLWISLIIAVACGAAMVQLVVTAADYHSFLLSQGIASSPVSTVSDTQGLANRMPVPPNPTHAVVDDRDTGGRILLGLESETTTSPIDEDASDSPSVFSDIGSRWSGRMAAVIDGDAEENCWSLFDFSMELVSTNNNVVHGRAGYATQPARCSVQETGYGVSFDVHGQFGGNVVELVLTNRDNRNQQLIFRGLAAQNTLTGTLFLSDGRMVTGPVTLTLG